MEQNVRYGIQLAILYAIIWFVDLLDASLLNIALPGISKYFKVDPTNAEWVLVGFLLAIIIGMTLSNPVNTRFGARPVFIGSQWLYIISSLACGFAFNFSSLVIFRVLQGFGGGLAIPVGMNLIMSVMPKDKWAKTGSWMNIFSLLAPAFGPILAGYITTYLNWRWLFFVKLPLSLCAVIFSLFWVKSTTPSKEKKFDWMGFLFASVSLCLVLLVFTEAGKSLFSKITLIAFLVVAAICGYAFIWQERRTEYPLVSLKIFRFSLFSWGNIVQSAANVIFLGSTFIVALYLQWGVGFHIVDTGWMMAAITLGMIAVMPLTVRYYNRVGPLPYIITGLLLMSAAMFALIFVTKETSRFLIAFIIFCEGAGSAGLQTTNFVSIFSEIPEKLKGIGSAVYSILKQVSASFGIALSTFALTLAMNIHGIKILTTSSPKNVFYGPLILLGTIPLAALFCCFFIDNARALKSIKSKDHLETEFEEGAE